MRKKRNAAGVDRGARKVDQLGERIAYRDSADAGDGQEPLRAIYDGRTCLGRIYSAGKSFRAELDDGTDVGIYSTIAAARCKIFFKAGDRLLKRSAA